MAGYGYSYRSQSPYDVFNPWKAERSCNSEHICRPALDESEGRRVITGDPYQYPGTYVMKVETTVERVDPSMFSEYYRSPPTYERRPSYGGVNNRQHGPSIPSNDRPPVVEEFFNNIQSEVSQQPFGFGAPRAPYQLSIPVSAGYYVSLPYQNEVSQPSGYGASRAPYQHRIPVSAGYYTGDGDHERERRNRNTIKEEDPKAAKILKPPVTTEGGNWPRPGNPAGSAPPTHPISYEREQTTQPPSMTMTGRRERRAPNMELSTPINDIGMAMEYLKKVADPSSVNTIKDEAPDPSHFRGDKNPKPPVATERGPTGRPGHPTGGERTIQPPFGTMTGGWERRGHDMGLEPRNETGKAAEYSKEAVKPPPVSTVPKRDSNPETIDNNEARRRYGNLAPAPEQYATGYTSTIDSREAVRKYNGQFV